MNKDLLLYLYRLLCGGAAIFIYVLILRPILKTIALDIFDINRSYLDYLEKPLFVIVIILLTLLFLYFLALYRQRSISTDMKISNEINPNTYLLNDYNDLKKYYTDTIRTTFQKCPENYNIISKHYPKTVFALTGGWRAGKTSTAGMLLSMIRDDPPGKILSETYHDTFNFGNVDESIYSFFGSLAEKTNIDEFNMLAVVSTASVDMTFSIGPISIKSPFKRRIPTNEIRKKVFDKLTSMGGIHVVIIDDLDRLLPQEQAMWVRVIELLSKFQGRILLIVPVHILQLRLGLSSMKLNAEYIDKILPYQYPVGVNIAYIKSKFDLDDNDSSRQRILYSKYLISLAMRQVISRIADSTHTITDSTQWLNEVDNGEVSDIVKELYSHVYTYKDGGLNMIIGATDVNLSNQAVWLLDGQTGDDDSFLTSLIKYRFIPNSIKKPDNVNEGDIGRLKNSNNLLDAFNQQPFQIGARHTRPDFSNTVGWGDYWIEAIWPAIEPIASDPNLATYFKYQLIDKEVAELMIADEEQVAAILTSFILKWNYDTTVSK